MRYYRLYTWDGISKKLDYTDPGWFTRISQQYIPSDGWNNLQIDTPPQKILLEFRWFGRSDTWIGYAEEYPFSLQHRSKILWRMTGIGKMQQNGEADD